MPTRFTTLLAGTVLIAVLAGCAPTTPPVAAPTATPTPEATPAPPTLAEFLATWDDFDVLVVEGTGDSTIPIPAGLTNGMVTATHDGSSYFEVRLVDDAGENAGYPLVETKGPYAGATGWGINHTDSEVETRFQIVADGTWTFRLEPLSNAPIFAVPVEGSSDAIYQYDGPYVENYSDLTELTVVSEGDSNFSLAQYYGDRDIELHVNEIGANTYPIVLEEGPSLFAVHATAPWSVRAG